MQFRGPPTGGVSAVRAGDREDIRVVTDQQRSSTEQVVLAIEHIAEGSRSVAVTAQEIASAALRRGELATELAGSGWKSAVGAPVVELQIARIDRFPESADAKLKSG